MVNAASHGSTVESRRDTQKPEFAATLHLTPNVLQDCKRAQEFTASLW